MLPGLNLIKPVSIKKGQGKGNKQGGEKRKRKHPGAPKLLNPKIQFSFCARSNFGSSQVSNRNIPSLMLNLLPTFPLVCVCFSQTVSRKQLLFDKPQTPFWGYFWGWSQEMILTIIFYRGITSSFNDDIKTANYDTTLLSTALESHSSVIAANWPIQSENFVPKTVIIL